MNDEKLAARRERKKLYLREYRKLYPERMKASLKKYYEKNREKKLAYSKVYGAKYEARNKEKRKSQRKAWEDRNRERRNKRRRERRRLNPEIHNEKQRIRRAKDPEKARRACREQYWKHLEKRRLESRKYSLAKAGRRRARLSNAFTDNRGIKDWVKFVRGSDFLRCYFCRNLMLGERCEIDHVIPLSRGGAHALFNLAASCLACNRSKHSKTPCEWPEFGQLLLNL